MHAHEVQLVQATRIQELELLVAQYAESLAQHQALLGATQASSVDDAGRLALHAQELTEASALQHAQELEYAQALELQHAQELEYAQALELQHAQELEYAQALELQHAQELEYAQALELQHAQELEYAHLAAQQAQGLAPNGVQLEATELEAAQLQELAYLEGVAAFEAELQLAHLAQLQALQSLG
ncbi:MAG TPA: hypothetical protein VJN18_35395 [Polyangiaceae bacterium]|nr:hypothetical protein [Polyangiaceae bacterium]